MAEARTSDGGNACTATHPDDIDWVKAWAQEKAARWLWRYLESKPEMSATSSTIKSHAALLGITRGALDAARKRMGVSVYERGDFDPDEGGFTTTAWSLQHLRAVRIGLNLYRPKPPRRTGKRQPKVVEESKPITANQVYRDKIRRQVETVAHHVASRPWPNRAREARVMGTILRRCGKQNNLTTTVNLWNLTDECGLAGWESVKDALEVLQTGGWIRVTPGNPNKYEKGQFEPTERGKPTIVTLIPKTGPCYLVERLPNGARDEFAGAPGNSRWLFVMRVLFEGRTDGLTRPEIEKMTGLSRKTVQHLVKTETLLYKTTAGTWNVITPELLTKEGRDSKMQSRRAKRKPPKRKTTDTKTPAPIDQDLANIEVLRDRIRKR